MSEQHDLWALLRDLPVGKAVFFNLPDAHAQNRVRNVAATINRETRQQPSRGALSCVVIDAKVFMVKRCATREEAAGWRQYRKGDPIMHRIRIRPLPPALTRPRKPRPARIAAAAAQPATMSPAKKRRDPWRLSSLRHQRSIRLKEPGWAFSAIQSAAQEIAARYGWLVACTEEGGHIVVTRLDLPQENQP